MSTSAGRIASPTTVIEREREPGRGAVERLLSFSPWIATAATFACFVLGCLSLTLDSVDSARLPLLGAQILSLGLLLALVRYDDGRYDAELMWLLAASVVGIVVLALLPEWLYGWQVNAIVHRSIFTALILLGISTPAFCASLFYSLGATPSARDTSRLPIVLLPVGVAVTAYGMILVRLVREGLPDLSWHALHTRYTVSLESGLFAAKGGLLTHIEGTLLLVVMTLLIALPIGIGAGTYVSEYGGRIGSLISFSASMLRAVSVFIIALAAFSVVQYVQEPGTGHGVLSNLLLGSYDGPTGLRAYGRGSFLLASIFLAILIIPVIARGTEEGLRSLPRDIREGSLALGATDGHALLRILLPWALPNIITAALLGAAEAAGSLTVLLFIRSTGEHGVGPFKEVTSLSAIIFDARNGTKTFKDAMSQFYFTAALLMVMLTSTLSVAALVLRQRLARQRGGISYD